MKVVRKAPIKKITKQVSEKRTNKALIGNKFWMKRSSHGRKPIFKDPEQLLDASLQYFNYVAENPLQELKIVGTNYGRVIKDIVPHMQAMTVMGLCIFLDIAHITWLDYRDNRSEGFTRVCKYVEGVIYHQKFTGAAAGFLNHAIIARDLGLVDKKDVTSDGKAVQSCVIVLPAKENVK